MGTNGFPNRFYTHGHNWYLKGIENGIAHYEDHDPAIGIPCMPRTWHCYKYSPDSGNYNT